MTKRADEIKKDMKYFHIKRHQTLIKKNILENITVRQANSDTSGKRTRVEGPLRPTYKWRRHLMDYLLI